MHGHLASESMRAVRAMKSNEKQKYESMMLQGASRYHHRNAGFIRQRPVRHFALPDKSGVPADEPFAWLVHSRCAQSLTLRASKSFLVRHSLIFAHSLFVPVAHLFTAWSQGWVFPFTRHGACYSEIES